MGCHLDEGPLDEGPAVRRASKYPSAPPPANPPTVRESELNSTSDQRPHSRLPDGVLVVIHPPEASKQGLTFWKKRDATSRGGVDVSRGRNRWGRGRCALSAPIAEAAERAPGRKARRKWSREEMESMKWREEGSAGRRCAGEQNLRSMESQQVAISRLFLPGISGPPLWS